MKKEYYKNSGFTLLEALITVAIIGGVGILISQVFFTTTRVNTKTELLKNVKQDGQFAMDNLSRSIRGAIKVTSTDCSDAGVAASAVSIENPNGDITTYGCLYDSTAGVSRIASTSASSGQSVFLTSENVTLGGTSCSVPAMTLSFVCTTIPDSPTRIGITYTLSQKGTPADQFERASQQFETSVSLRN